MQIVTEEQIHDALAEAGICIKDICLYELSNSGFGASLNLPRFRVKIQSYRIDSENKVSYICGTKKVNKKKLYYTDRYTGCMQHVVKAEDLVNAIWLECNKFTIIDALRCSRNIGLYKRIAKELEKDA